MSSDKKENDSKMGLFIALGMCFGSSLGVTFGAVTDNLPIGVALGSSFGLMAGAAAYILWQSSNKDQNDES